VAKTHKITYKVFLFERVKKKVKFFNTETYPLQIRLTAGIRTLYLKSYFFAVLQQNKYQQEVQFNAREISIDDVICSEEELIKYILDKKKPASLDVLRLEYGFLSYDILHELDESFKKFLVDFFYAEKLPAYALFIRNDGSNHTSEFILDNLEMSLQPAVYDKLLQSAVEKAPPYIPFIKFFRENMNNPLPVFPVYQWQQETVSQKFHYFIDRKFPEYGNSRPADYVNKLLERLPDTHRAINLP
jgi:hypothetical protein